MALKDLLDQATNSPKTVAVALFACLVVGGVGATFYLKVSEARIALLDERVRSQENDSKKQQKINRLVQEQVGSLRRSFEGLPPAVLGVRSVLAEATKAKQVPPLVRDKIDGSLKSVEQQLFVLQSAITNSDALSKSLEALVIGAIAQEEGRFADAARSYRVAADAGVPEAQARLAKLYLAGSGVQKNVDLAARLLETSALLGNTGAKDDAVELYLAGYGSRSPNARAAALLSIEPRTSTQSERLQSLLRRLDQSQLELMRAEIETLRQQQENLVDKQPEQPDTLRR